LIYVGYAFFRPVEQGAGALPASTLALYTHAGVPARRRLLGLRGLHGDVGLDPHEHPHRVGRPHVAERRAADGAARRRGVRAVHGRHVVDRVSGLFWILDVLAPAGTDADEWTRRIPFLIVGFGFGASFVALFAQLGGGIYTKAADVGADLVGKVEAGIPEDDPRNPAVIADLVGDNVGDCAGRGADLFESTAAENIGAMILGVLLYPFFGVKGVLFPLVVGAVGLLASIVGVMIVRTGGDEDPMKALNRGFYVTSAIVAAALFGLCRWLLTGPNVPESAWLHYFACAMVGLATAFAFVYITQYYTEYRYRPVLSIAEASQTGPATNIIAGLAVGMESTVLPVFTVAIAIVSSYYLGRTSGLTNAAGEPIGGLFGTAVATMGMLGTAGYILAMDVFGPITDNAGGIVEMSDQPRRSARRPTASTRWATRPRRSPRATRSARRRSRPSSSSRPTWTRCAG
jgi:K(+)-stimulated pyrophosphate-energized sodium pump